MFEYNMTEQMAKSLLTTRDANEKRMNPKDFLVKVVNEQFCLKEPCTSVKVTL